MLCTQKDPVCIYVILNAITVYKVLKQTKKQENNKTKQKLAWPAFQAPS